ncbi:MAG TPA: YibE/F family protein [Candidatus Limnocylindrales bacterium]|nr:YibE/F family protein [Candidatus Limnocylindrales bacterium]
MRATPSDEVPFAGLRRNATALVAGLLIVLAIFVLVPDIAPRPTGLPPVELVHGRILEIMPTSDPGTPDVRIEVVEGIPGGPKTGDVVEGFIQGPSGLESRPDFKIGDDVIVNISTDPVAGFIAVNDRYRVPTLALLLGLFAAAVTLVGGWRGVRSLIALALTLAVVVKLVVPLILAGWEPAWVAIVAASGVTVTTFLLTEGARRQTVAAALGTAVSLTLVAVLATLFDSLARFSPLRGSEEAGFLISMGGTELDLGGLILAAVIFGALGVLDDVTITQAATVQELWESDPGVRPWTLVGRAMNVGRSHIAATVNTLVLAYVGASLPLIVLFAAGRQDPLLIVSGEVVAVEVVRALVGSIGIVAAVPVTTMVAVGLIGRRLPFIGEGTGVRRAPGWD